MSTHPLARIEGQELSSAERIRSALNRYQAAGVEWVAATLALATELWRARLKHASDNAFSDWLAENELDILTKDERAALIGMGKNGTASKRVLETTSRRSVRCIWLEEIKPQIPVSQRCETDAARKSKPETPKTGVESKDETLARVQVFHAKKVLAVLNQLKSTKFTYHLKMAEIDFIQITVQENGKAKIELHQRQRGTVITYLKMKPT